MKTIVALGLIFVGLWGIAYNSNPTVFGTHTRSLVSFGVLAAITTAGLGLLFSNRDAK
jgi:hypothetical protein